MWDPLRQDSIDKIEAVQKRTTRLITACSHLPHKERLKIIKLSIFSSQKEEGELDHVVQHDTRICARFCMTCYNVLPRRKDRTRTRT